MSIINPPEISHDVGTLPDALHHLSRQRYHDRFSLRVLYYQHCRSTGIHNGITVTSGYSVSGTENVGGGDVIFIIPPASGSVVMLERGGPTYRLTDYQDNGDILADRSISILIACGW